MSVMQSQDYDYRLPRLFIDAPLEDGAEIGLTGEQAHYLKTVMRRPEGAQLRVFNARHGEWLGQLAYPGKKEAVLRLERQIRLPATRAQQLHLIFAPIKKDRMDFMIEKAVELGAAHLHPVLTQYTTIREINEERIRRQIIEAAEQCERLDLPVLHPAVPLKNFVSDRPNYPVFAALERANAPFIGSNTEISAEIGLLIGPEGGFSSEEQDFLIESEKFFPVSLGDNILRAETAAIFGLSVLISNFPK